MLQIHTMHLDCSHHRKRSIESSTELLRGNRLGKVDEVHDPPNALLRFLSQKDALHDGRIHLENVQQQNTSHGNLPLKEGNLRHLLLLVLQQLLLTT